MSTDAYRSTKLGEICEKPQYGYTASARREPAGPKFLRITDLQDQRIDWSTVPWCEANQADVNKYMLSHGDVLVARIGASTGSTSIVVTPPPSVFASYLIRFRATRGVHPFFLYFYTKSQQFRDWIDAHKDSNLKGGVNVPVLLAAPVLLPPYQVQTKIAAVLWKMQRAITTQDRLIAATRDLKQSAMQHIFTHGLRGEPLKDTVVGQIPDSWSAARLDACCEVVSSSMPYADLLSAADSDAEHVTVVHGVKVSDMNLPGNELEFTHVNLSRRVESSLAKRKAIPPETVTFPKRGAAIATNKKRLTTAWTILDPNIIGVRPKPGLDHRYLFQWFQQFDLRTITEPGPTPQLNKKNLTPLKLPVPPTEAEQRSIAAALATIDRKLAHHQRKRTALDDLFQSTLHQLMTAQIRVTDLAIDTSEVTTPSAQGVHA